MPDISSNPFPVQSNSRLLQAGTGVAQRQSQGSNPANSAPQSNIDSSTRSADQQAQQAGQPRTIQEHAANAQQKPAQSQPTENVNGEQLTPDQILDKYDG